MSHAWFHAQSSAKRFGGVPEDYLAIHNWFDETKLAWADPRHRALRHHSLGIFQAETIFGVTITNSDGRQIPVRLIGERHVSEDCGFIPSPADWLSGIPFENWMQLSYRKALEIDSGALEPPVPRARSAGAEPAHDRPSPSPQRRLVQRRVTFGAALGDPNSETLNG